VTTTQKRRSTARRPRKKLSRARRFTNKVTFKRARIRWKRRARRMRNTYRSVKQAPSKVREGVQQVRQAPGKAKARVAGSYRKTRAKVTPSRGVKCSCGKTVPVAQVETHLARHRKRADVAQRKAEKTRAAVAKPRPAVTAGAPVSTSSTAPPSRAEAARTAGSWGGIGSALIAAPLFLNSSPWLGAVGAGCVAIGGVAYATERRWGVSSHQSRETRRALKQQARSAGCSSACMVSTAPAKDCRCPCGGTTHGSAKAA
jgi:hypothetical protein